jgi:antitoxin component YwqK of YwqJK toxin-antitoxin module
MYKIITLLILIVSIKMTAQNKVVFEYDTAGNQIKRMLCINCATNVGRNSADAIKDITKLTEDDMQKSFPEDVISYYPNPVKEELFLKWELIDNNKVVEIQIYNLSGQLLRSYNKLDSQNNQNIIFQEYPQGIYTLILLYSNATQKSLKIVKQ